MCDPHQRSPISDPSFAPEFTAQRNRLFERPRAVRINGDARFRKASGERTDGLDLCGAGEDAALELEVLRGGT